MTAIATTPIPELIPAGTAVVGPSRSAVVARQLRRLGALALRAGITVVALLWLLPTAGLAIASLRSPADNSATGWWNVFAAPSELTLSNYGRVLGDPAILGSLWNTVLITVPATILVVAIGSLAAYALSWVEFRGREVLFVITVALNVVPIQVAIIPDATIFRYLGVYGHIAAVVAFHVAFGLPFAIFLLRNFFASIPRELIEAARVDGANDRMIFTRVVLRVGWPAVASLAIFEFLWVWNDLLVALVFATSDNAPITYALREQTRAFSSNIDIIGPGSLLSMLIPLLVFFLFQRYFVQGVLAGSMK
jgi:alpha-glucoside transport system permease protein